MVEHIKNETIQINGVKINSRIYVATTYTDALAFVAALYLSGVHMAIYEHKYNGPNIEFTLI